MTPLEHKMAAALAHFRTLTDADRGWAVRDETQQRPVGWFPTLLEAEAHKCLMVRNRLFYEECQALSREQDNDERSTSRY